MYKTIPTDNLVIIEASRLVRVLDKVSEKWGEELKPFLTRLRRKTGEDKNVMDCEEFVFDLERAVLHGRIGINVDKDSTREYELKRNEFARRLFEFEDCFKDNGLGTFFKDFKTVYEQRYLRQSG